MTKILYVALLILLSNQTFASVIEGHLECEPYAAKIAQLNQTESPYFDYSVSPTYRYVGEDTQIPTCYFSKKTSGGVSIKIKITKDVSFVEINQKLKSFKNKLNNLSSDSNKGCYFDTSSFYLNEPSNPSNNKYEITFYGSVYCYSDYDLNVLESLDIEKLLTTTTKGTEFTFEIFGEPSPSVSGTTIHN